MLRAGLIGILLMRSVPIPMPPSWQGVSSMGCDVSNRTDEPENPHIAQLWRTFVWAEFPNKENEFPSGKSLGASDSVAAGVWTPRSSGGHHERLAFSTHNPDERAKALEACDRWMKAAQEQIKKGRR